MNKIPKWRKRIGHLAAMIDDAQRIIEIATRTRLRYCKYFAFEVVDTKEAKIYETLFRYTMPDLKRVEIINDDKSFGVIIRGLIVGTRPHFHAESKQKRRVVWKKTQ